MPEVMQPSFSAGELTPMMYSRVDMARYYTGLRTCRNFLIKPTGGVTNRAGTYFVDSSKFPARKSRLIPFVFNEAQSYLLEFGHLYIRVVYRGAYIESAPGVPVEVDTIYPEESLFEIDYTQSADVMTITHQAYPTQQFSRYAHDDWRIDAFLNTNGPFQDLNIDDSKTVSSSNSTGNVIITSPVDMFTTGNVGQLMKIEQSPESLTPVWEVGATIAINEIRKTSSGYYQAITAGTTGTVRPDHLEGIAYDGNPGVSWKYLHSGSGILQITGFTSAKVVTGTVPVTSRLPDSLVSGSVAQTITLLIPGDPGSAGPPPVAASPTVIKVVGHGYVNGTAVTISGVTGHTSANGAWVISVIDLDNFSIPDFDSTAWTGGGVVTRVNVSVPSYKWAFEMWGVDDGYPKTTAYYQQRQIFGGHSRRPNSIQMSRSGGFTDFIQSVPLLDDEAVTCSINSGSVGQVLHFVNLKQLICLTTEGPWLIIKEQGNPIPITDPQGEGGAAILRPLKIGKQALYVESKGSAVRSLGYEFSSDTYEGKDLTITADHLFEGYTIVDWAYQKVPNRVVWMVRSDGILIGLTYMVEQEIVGWHRHDTDGFVESVAVISEGNEDVVYLSIRRVLEGSDVRYIEKMSSRKFATDADCYFVDCGLSYDGRDFKADGVNPTRGTLTGGVNWDYTETLIFTVNYGFFVGESDIGDAIVIDVGDGNRLRLTITEYVSSTVVRVMANKTVPEAFRNALSGFDMARNTLLGLGHLEGKTVSILSEGNVSPSRTVTGGSVTIQSPGTVVHIGLGYESDLETLDINAQGQTWQDRAVNVNSVSLMVRDTRGLMAGPDADNLFDARTPIGSKYDELYQKSTGNIPINIVSDWSKGGRVFVRQALPLPATINAIIPTIAVAGS